MSSKFCSFFYSIAILIICLIPISGMINTTVNADSTSSQIVSDADDDYVFFVVDEGRTPLAAIPSDQSFSYLIWIVAGTLCMFVLFVYTSWYLTIRKNLWELSGKVSPIERKALKTPNGFFHPIRSYRLFKEAEHEVASFYSNLF